MTNIKETNAMKNGAQMLGNAAEGQAKGQPLLFLGCVSNMGERFDLQVVNAKNEPQEVIKGATLGDYARKRFGEGRNMQNASMLDAILSKFCGFDINEVRGRKTGKVQSVASVLAWLMPAAMVVASKKNAVVTLNNEGTGIVISNGGKRADKDLNEMAELMASDKSFRAKCDALRKLGEASGKLPKPAKREGQAGQGKSASEIAETASDAMILMACRDVLKDAVEGDEKDGKAWGEPEELLLVEISKLVAKLTK